MLTLTLVLCSSVRYSAGSSSVFVRHPLTSTSSACGLTPAKRALYFRLPTILSHCGVGGARFSGTASYGVPGSMIFSVISSITDFAAKQLMRIRRSESFPSSNWLPYCLFKN